MGNSLCDLMLLFVFRHKRSKIEPDKGILPNLLTQRQVVVRDAHKWVYLSIFPMNGYDTLYNPFGRYPGMAYPQTLKIVIAPANGGWTRILVEAEPDIAVGLATHLSQMADILSVELAHRVAFLRVYHAGQQVDLENGLHPHLQPGHEAALHHALHAESLDLLPLDDTAHIGDIALNDLPDEVQAMAQQVKGKQADGLFRRLSQQLLQAVSPRQANELLDSRPDWHSQGGQLIRAVMACLTIPDNWRTPDFATLRSAYAIQARRQHDPNAPLLPGDDHALRPIPNALDYTPVYGGKSNG